MRKRQTQPLQWVATYTNARDAVIAASPEQIKIFTILQLNIGLRPNVYDKGYISWDVINNDNFSLQWGISEDVKGLLTESSPLWLAEKQGLKLPAYANVITEAYIRKREGGAKGGLMKAQNKKRKAAALNTSSGNPRGEAEQTGYTIPADIAEYADENNNTDHAK